MSRILITIPAWNESQIIERTLEKVTSVTRELLSTHDVLIEVADNASTDGTPDRVQEWIAHSSASPKLRATRSVLPSKGKGLAIRLSWERHLDDRDIFIFTDADLAADLSVLPEMVRLIENGETDIVCGSRFAVGATVKRRMHREFASRLYRFLQHVILRLPVQDAQCGLKAISSVAARKLLPLCRETGWLFDSELLYLAKSNALRTTEIPVAWIEHRDPSRRSAMNVLRDGWGFLLGLARIRFRQRSQA
jgi:glycosyltransferase involved in cell wall biosynthesis